MTVAELIKELEKANQNSVVVAYKFDYMFGEVKAVDKRFQNEGKRLVFLDLE